jgi:exopolysaccharide biosynthesis polyprenyl glycosylphosphotransferase
LLVSDIVIAACLLFASAVWAYDSNLAWLSKLSVPGGVFVAIVIAVTVVFVVVCNFAMGLYQRRFMRGRKLVQSIVLCAVIGLVALLFMDNLFLRNSFRFSELVLLQVTLYAMLAISRPLICNIYENFVPKKRLALIGSPSMAEQVRFAFDSASPADAVLVDHYDYDTKAGHSGLADMLNTACSNPGVDEVFVEMSAPDLQLHYGASSSRKLSSTLSLFDRYVRWTDNEMIDIAHAEAVIKKGHASFWIKRILETSVSLAVMIFLLPVVICSMIAIKLEDGGSLFYRQTRVGKHGKHFSVLKFRSMVENAEKAGSPQWATIGDSRVTRVGSFLRKSRIDELPQLLNVIKGDMALVGPRPERPEFVEYLSTEVANFDLRHAVRPGLTGWAQISYPYGASLEDARWKTRYDLYYICNWTIWFDIAIIMQTVRVVLLAEGSR